MEEIEKLELIGAREISKKTHIALNKVESILRMAYGNLQDKTTTIGLIKILEREYHLDLHQWCEEYEKFWEEYQEKYQETEDKSEANINFKITHETNPANNIKKNLIVTAIVLVLIIIGVYFYFNSNQFKEIINTPKEQTQENNPQISNLDSSASTPINKEPQQLTEQNNLKQEVMIVPAAEMWIGIFYLDSKQKLSIITKDPFILNLKRPQTIITGHGNLDIKSNDEVVNYNTQEQTYFYIDEKGEFSNITKEQYQEYSKGLVW